MSTILRFVCASWKSINWDCLWRPIHLIPHEFGLALIHYSNCIKYCNRFRFVVWVVSCRFSFNADENFEIVKIFWSFFFNFFPHFIISKLIISFQTALHWAAKHGNENVIKLIAGSLKADVNCRTVSLFPFLIVLPLNFHKNTQRSSIELIFIYHFKEERRKLQLIILFCFISCAYNRKLWTHLKHLRYCFGLAFAKMAFCALLNWIVFRKRMA